MSIWVLKPIGMRRILKVYDVIVSMIVSGLVFVMVGTLVLAFADILATLFHLIPNLKDVRLNDVQFRELVTGILDVFIIIELFGTIIDYVRLRRLRLSALIDVVAVFILRDMLAKIYANTVPTDELLVLAVLLMTMVIARSITGRFPPKSDRDG